MVGTEKRSTKQIENNSLIYPAFLENLEKVGEKLAHIKEGPYVEMPRLKVLIEYEKRIAKSLKRTGLGRIGWISLIFLIETFSW